MKSSVHMRRIWGGRALIFSAGFCFLLFSQTHGHAGTLLHGARASGMAAAFVAVADDPSALLHNPAGLAGLEGTNIYLGVTAILGSTEFENPGGETEEVDFQVHFPPHFYISSDFDNEDMALGIGVYSPFGIGGLEWPANGLTRYIATKNLIGTLAVNPVFAYRVSPSFSFGLGFFYLYALFDSERMIDQSALEAEDGKFSLEGQGGGFGYNLSVLIHPGQKISFGVAYRSGVEVDQDIDINLTNLAPALQPLTGGPSIDIDADTSLDFPQVLSFGTAYRPTDSLTVGLEIEWTEWSRFNRMDLDLKKEIPSAGISDFAIDFDYRDTWFFKIGAEFKIKDNYFLRGGYGYITNPVPEHTLNPGNPDADQHSLSVGFGYKKEKWALDLFYTADIFEDRTVDNEILKGKYENLAHFIGLSLGYRF